MSPFRSKEVHIFLGHLGEIDNFEQPRGLLVCLYCLVFSDLGLKRGDTESTISAQQAQKATVNMAKKTHRVQKLVSRNSFDAACTATLT